MKIDKRILYVVQTMVALFVIWATVGMFLNSKRISSVGVHLNENGVEHRDKSIGEIGKDDEPPDYRLRCRTDDGWKELGTYANTWIGEGLVFEPNSNLPEGAVIEIQLLDDDKLEDDVLEQYPYESDVHVGSNYTINIDTTVSLESGFAWFFKTPVGIAILVGIGLAFFLMAISVVQI